MLGAPTLLDAVEVPLDPIERHGEQVGVRTAQARALVLPPAEFERGALEPRGRDAKRLGEVPLYVESDSAVGSGSGSSPMDSGVTWGLKKLGPKGRFTVCGLPHVSHFAITVVS